MKKSLASAVVACLLSLPLLTGCATSLKTETAADTTMSAAMVAWGNYVQQFHPPVSQELQVRAAFVKYQAAEIASVDATKALFDLTSTNATPSAADAAAAKDKVAIATQAASLALADLVSLLGTFGITVHASTTTFSPVPGPSVSPTLPN